MLLSENNALSIVELTTTDGTIQTNTIRLQEEDAEPFNYSQATFHPHQDMIVVSKQYQNKYQVCIKRAHGPFIGHNLVTITTRFLSFYNYWSPDGTCLSWLSNHVQTVRCIALWIVNITDMLYNYYQQHKDHEYISVWEYYHNNKVNIEMHVPLPTELGRPYFYCWSPLPELPPRIKTSTDPSLLRLVQQERVHAQNMIIAHPNSGPLRLLDCSAFYEREKRVDRPTDYFMTGNDLKITNSRGTSIQQNAFDTPLWLPNGDIVHVVRNDDSNSIQFENENKIVQQIQAENGPMSMAVSKNGKYFAYCSIYESVLYVVNLVTKQKYRFYATDMNFFQFCTNRQGITRLVIFVYDTSPAYWLVWTPPADLLPIVPEPIEMELDVVAKKDINNYMHGAVVPFFCQYNLSLGLARDDYLAISHEDGVWIVSLAGENKGEMKLISKEGVVGSFAL
jgi:hypothetical protein